MKHVRVRLSANGREGEIHPMYDVLANAPFVERAKALQWNYTGDAFGILHYVEGAPDAFETRIADIPAVRGYEIERVGERAFYVYIRDETTAGLRDLFEQVTEGGLVIVPPWVYHEDGTVTLSLFGPEQELQMESVPGPVSVDIEQVSGLSTTTAAVETQLSSRQREAVSVAVELGYYDVPRTASHEEVAEAIDCAPSTAGEHLRKAESKLIRTIVSTL